jgi:hypothetical protein
MDRGDLAGEAGLAQVGDPEVGVVELTNRADASVVQLGAVRVSVDRALAEPTSAVPGHATILHPQARHLKNVLDFDTKIGPEAPAEAGA